MSQAILGFFDHGGTAAIIHTFARGNASQDRPFVEIEPFARTNFRTGPIPLGRN
jgi:hypothetical protein